MEKTANKVPKVGKIFAAVIAGCACCGCAAYMAEQQPETTAELENKIAHVEWRVILFRWPPDDIVVSEGVTNTARKLFMPYLRGPGPQDDLHGDLPQAPKQID